MKKNNFYFIFIVTAVILFLLFIYSLSIGQADTKFKDVLYFLLGKFPKGANNNLLSTIIIQLRLPRILLAALTGAALGTCGLIFQSTLRNPLADPYLLGVSSGSALGIVAYNIFGLSNTLFFASPIAAILGGLLSISIVFYVIPRAFFKNQAAFSSTSFILSGVIISFFFNSIIIFLLTFSSSAELQNYFYWTIGQLSLASTSKSLLILPYFALIFPFLIYYSKALNLIQLDDLSALSLGADPFKTKKNLLILASILTSICVATSGPIGFVGLMVPHFTKWISGYDHRKTIFLVPLHGAIFLILADTIARTIGQTIEFPTGVITSFLGAPIFVFLLVSKRNTHGA